MVAKPGPYNVTSPMTVVQLIAFAGGLLEYADAKNIVIMRTENSKSRELQVQLQGSVRGQEPQAEHPAQTRRYGHCSVIIDVSIFSIRLRTIAVLLPALITAGVSCRAGTNR